MHFEFKLPDLGEGVMEAEIIAWHVQEGDRVAEDQPMLEVMTDKASVTIGAPRAGRIDELRAQVGTIAHVGDVLVLIQSSQSSRASDVQPEATPVATAVGDIRTALPGANYFARSELQLETVAQGAAMLAQVNHKPLATPAARKLARDLGLDLRSVPASGPRGRVTLDDVHAASKSVQPITPHARRPSVKPAGATTNGDKRVPFAGMRRRIAARMQEAKNTAAHFTFIEECDAARLMVLRDRLEPEAAARGVELTYLPFIVKAVCAALRKRPQLNSSLDADNNEIVVHARCNIGIAVATDQGLMVPVVNDADQLDLFQLATELKRLANAARAGELSVSELTGSTFTITSLGKQAGLLAVPILNLPNVGILGVHRIKQRPIVCHGRIAIGHIMLMSLSLDHRIIDGHIGAAFAYEVIANLEEPALMFAGV